jgi:hypothetical protein
MKTTVGMIRKAVREVLSEASGMPRPEVGIGAPVPATALKKGMRVLAQYKSYNEGEDRVEVLGIAKGNSGEGGVEFDSVRDAMKAAGVTSLRALEGMDDYFLVVRDLPYGDSGPWYYLFKGRWCRGSGAERLTFTLLP